MNKVIFLILYFFIINVSAQNNSIIFGDVYLGSVESLQIGTSLNYQYKRNLFTYRFTKQTRLKSDVVLLDIFLIVPILVINVENTTYEHAIMYGYRIIKNGHSFSFSLGCSYNIYKDFSSENVNISKEFGVPLQLTYRIFKKERKPYHIYSVISIGKPTSFGNSLSFKLIANISEHSFYGIGLSYGFGWHKKY